MRVSFNASLFLFASCALAHPAYLAGFVSERDAPEAPALDILAREPDDYGVFKQPGPNDIRGPCPGLNTLSNHGYLNRDGRNIGIGSIISKMDEFLGIGSDFGLVQVVGAGFRGAFKTTSSGLVLESYDVLTESHNNIEHDASFTRTDLGLGGSAAVNATLVEQMLSFSTDKVNLSPQDIAQARHVRIADTFNNNPTFTMEQKQTDALWREAALIRLVVGDKDTGNVRLDWLRSWFMDEKLPFHLGWQPHKLGGGVVDNIRHTNEFRDMEKEINAQTGDNFPITF